MLIPSLWRSASVLSSPPPAAPQGAANQLNISFADCTVVIDESHKLALRPAQ